MAAAYPTSCPDHLAWIGIYPLNLSHQTTVEFLRNHGLTVMPGVTSAYHIRTFEVPRTLIDADVHFSEQEMLNEHSYFAFGEEDLRTRIRALGLQIEEFARPFKCDYPI